MTSTRILIVEDEIIVASDLEIRLEKMGYSVCGLASSGQEAMTLARTHKPDIVIMDIVLKGELDGIETAALIRSEQNIPVIFLTAYADEHKLERAKPIEPYGYLVKPFQYRELKATIEMARYKFEMEARLRESEERYRLLVENATEAIFVIQDEKMVFANPTALKMSRSSMEEFLKKPVFEWIHPDEKPSLMALHQKRLRGEPVPQKYDFRFFDNNGELRWGAISAVRITWRGGRPATLNFGSDITERKNMEQALRESEARLKEAQRVAKIGNWDLHLDSSHTYWSDELARIFGYPPEMASADPAFILKLIHPDDVEDVQKLSRSVVKELTPRDFQFRFIRRDGSSGYAHVHANVEVNQKGRAVRLFGTLQDITKKVQMEEAVRQSEAKYRLIVETANEAIWMVDNQGGTTFVNDKMAEMFGYAVDEMIGLSTRDLFCNGPDLNQGNAEDKHEELSKTTFERKYRKKDGSTLWGLTSTTPIYDEKNKPAGAFAMITDVTEQKKTKEALVRSEWSYAIAQQAANIGSWDLDITNNSVYWSRQAAATLGVDYENLSSNNDILKDIIETDDFSKRRLAIERCINDSENAGYSIEYRVKKTDQSIRWIAETGNLVKNEDGAPVRLAGVIQDVTKRKIAEQQLLAYQEQLRNLASELTLAEARERRKIATDLHDQIGQILFLLKIKIESLAEFSDSGELSDIGNECSTLVDQILQDVRTLIVDISPPTLHVLGLEEAVEELAEKIEKDHDLKVVIKTRGNKVFLSEDMRDLLYRAVREVMFNTIKHARAGSIFININRSRQNVTIDIKDDGIGFAVEDMRAGPAPKGGGYGLFSIRERLGPMGGQLIIESNPGRGTRTTLSAPILEN